MLNLVDIITLAKQGYKPGDIKELIELSKTVPEPEPEPNKNGMPEDDKKEPEPPTEPPIDYAAEIAKLKAENEKIKHDLSIAQEANRSKGAPEIDKKSDDEIIKDMMLSFMR